MLVFGAGGVRERLKPRKRTGVFVFGAGGCQGMFKVVVRLSSRLVEEKLGRTLPSLIPGYPGDV